ncbi:hypothetical protein [Streptomyces massasporeus]|uniref:hypothetical protein n=1 Tax=Streptomyces massasporeus TaxID=67324 RepID=UPI003702E660
MVTALTVPAPVPVRLVADPLPGHRLRIADGEPTLDIGAVTMAVVALFASPSGWGLPATLERCGVRRAHAIRTAMAGACWPRPSCLSSATAWTAEPPPPRP